VIKRSSVTKNKASIVRKNALVAIDGLSVLRHSASKACLRCHVNVAVSTGEKEAFYNVLVQT
jgi:hypothetical protein